MKKLLLSCAVMALFTLTSCSGGYNSEKALQLCEKVAEDTFTESDVEALLEQYKACLIEIKPYIEKKKEDGLSDEEQAILSKLLEDYHQIEWRLSNRDVERSCPGTETKFRKIFREYSWL